MVGGCAYNQFKVHANGPGFYPMLVAALMKGIDRSDCPTQLFLP